MREPQARIDMMRRSLRCLVSGGIGLIPVLGLPWSILALLQFSRVRLRYGEESNPARLHLAWGLTLGLLGLVLSSLVCLGLGLAWARALGRG
jgi:hypothetical protein